VTSFGDPFGLGDVVPAVDAAGQNDVREAGETRGSRRRRATGLDAQELSGTDECLRATLFSLTAWGARPAFWGRRECDVTTITPS
jgi:hypothetical protein